MGKLSVRKAKHKPLEVEYVQLTPDNAEELATRVHGQWLGVRRALWTFALPITFGGEWRWALTWSGLMELQLCIRSRSSMLCMIRPGARADGHSIAKWWFKE